MSNSLSLHVHYGDGALAEVQGRHDGVLNALLVLLGRLEPVDDQFNEMGLVTVQSSDFIKLTELTIYTDLRISTLTHLLEQLLVMALTAPYQRSEQVAFTACVVLHDQGDDLLVCISDHRFACLRRVRCRRTGIEKSQEVIDFRDRAHCRTRVVTGGLLLYGNDRTESCNRLYLRLFQYAHEVLGICGQRVHVAPLTLSVYGIECQR